MKSQGTPQGQTSILLGDTSGNPKGGGPISIGYLGMQRRLPLQQQRAPQTAWTAHSLGGHKRRAARSRNAALNPAEKSRPLGVREKGVRLILGPKNGPTLRIAPQVRGILRSTRIRERGEASMYFSVFPKSESTRWAAGRDVHRVGRGEGTGFHVH